MILCLPHKQSFIYKCSIDFDFVFAIYGLGIVRLCCIVSLNINSQFVQKNEISKKCLCASISYTSTGMKVLTFAEKYLQREMRLWTMIFSHEPWKFLKTEHWHSEVQHIGPCHNLCDIIKLNQLFVGNTDFKIKPIIALNFFCIWFFLWVTLKWSWNGGSNYWVYWDGVFAKIQLLKCLN